MVGILFQDKKFLNKMNILVKSMIFICKHRNVFFTSNKKLLYDINIEYYSSTNLHTLQIKNTFCSLGSQTLSIQNEYTIVDNRYNTSKSGMLNESKNEAAIDLMNYFLKAVNTEKKVCKQEYNIKLIAKSYLKVYLMRMISLPEELVDIILLFI